MEERLQKFIAEAGIASRRKAEELILAGRVSVNGNVVRELGVKVDGQKDSVSVDGKEIKRSEKLVYIMLNKPEGFVTTVKDQFNRPTVVDLLKGVNERVFPIGRLDYETSGMLILTNDGDLTYKLTHPKHDIAKTYIAKLYGTPDFNDVKKFKYGVTIDGKKTAPAKLEVVESTERFSTCRIVIYEGRNRQVRKMCSEIKHPVASLKRVGTGELMLGELEKGKYRFLTPKEVKYLKSL